MKVEARIRTPTSFSLRVFRISVLAPGFFPNFNPSSLAARSSEKRASMFDFIMIQVYRSSMGTSVI